MNKIITALSLLAIILVVTTATTATTTTVYAQTQNMTASSSTSTSTTYESIEDGIRFAVPEGWVVQPVGQGARSATGALVLAHACPEAQSRPAIGENLIVHQLTSD
jgi:quinol-cytochrome oxidoreductase complex cytochrome b subunit